MTLRKARFPREVVTEMLLPIAVMTSCDRLLARDVDYIFPDLGTLIFILFFSHTMTARGLHRLWALLSVVSLNTLAFTPRSPYLHHPLHSIIIVTLLSYLLAHRNNKSIRQEIFILSPSTLTFNFHPVDYPGNLTSQPASGPGSFILYFKLQLSSSGLP